MDRLRLRIGMRFELHLFTVSLGVWVLVILHLSGLVPLGGNLELSYRQLYAIAGLLGWLSGNIYLYRARGLVRAARTRFLLIYLLGPPSVINLLRALAPADEQAAAPLIPLYALAVFTIFFLVPVTLKPKLPPRRRS